MKKLLTALAALSILTVFSSTRAQAKEGLVTMSNNDVSCEAISLWKEGRYRITGRCEGLVYPYATQYNYYVLWVKTDSRGEYSRIGEVVKGYFDGGAADSFSNLYITAETSNLPRKPSGKNVVSGTVKAFSFDKSTDTTPAVVPTEQTSTKATANTNTMTVQGKTSTTTSNSTVGTVVSKILTSLLVIVGVVVALVIVTSLVFRRRGSVSA